MKVLVIYDATGFIWQTIYGAEEVPQGLPCMWVDVPDGAVLDRIDVTDPENPKAVFTYLPESDIGRLQHEVAEQEKAIKALREENADLSEQLTGAQMALVEQYETNLALEEEVTNTQMALCELFEGIGGLV